MILTNGTYRTLDGSTVRVSGEHAGIFDVTFDWFEEEDACVECVVDPVPVDGFLTWSCDWCGGGNAPLYSTLLEAS